MTLENPRTYLFILFCTYAFIHMLPPAMFRAVSISYLTDAFIPSSCARLLLSSGAPSGSQSADTYWVFALCRALCWALGWGTKLQKAAGTLPSRDWEFNRNTGIESTTLVGDVHDAGCIYK